MHLHDIFIFSVFLFTCSRADRGIPPPPPSTIIQQVDVRKCCLKNEYMDQNGVCRPLKNNTSPWIPLSDEITPFRINTTPLDCGPKAPWPVYDFKNSCEMLILLSDGSLRHYVFEVNRTSFECSRTVTDDTFYQDYSISDYCIDSLQFVQNDETFNGLGAKICVQSDRFPWHDPDFMIQRIINPLFHGIAIICLIIVAIVYFVLPQLCDIVGNIITTLVICIIFQQIAEIFKIYFEYHSTTSFLVADSLLYVSGLGTFFWLNSLGYYVWKTFRSRNVFMRISDGTKYCYYSAYAWGSTLGMSTIALFAHLILDINIVKKEFEISTDAAIAELGISVFLMTIVFTVIADIFFCLQTLQLMNRLSNYGRIQNKLKYGYYLFVKLFIIVTTNWFFLVLSWFRPRFLHNVFLYAHVIVNLFQAISILYITVFGLKKVRSLLKKGCCHPKCLFPCCRPGDNDEVPEWGEEMMAMNRN